MSFSDWQPIDDFLSIDRRKVHHGIITAKGARLSVQTSPQPWYYAVSFPCNFAAVPAGASHVLVRVNLLVSSGRVGIGALQADGNTFLAEQEFSAEDGPCTAELMIAVAARCDSIMLRNATADTTPSAVLVESAIAYCGNSPAIKSPLLPARNVFSDQRLLARGPVRTIVDVGANIGDTVQEYRKTFPDASIYAFEPAPATFKLLAQRFTRDARVKVFPLALADQSGTLPLHLFEDHATNSLFPFATDAGRFTETKICPAETIEVSTQRLDAFCAERSVDQVDIMKMDVQGSEMKVLHGARALFAAKRVGMVLTEANFVPLYTGQADFYDVMAFLGNYGFRLFDLYDIRRGDRGQMKWCDALFIRE